MNEITDLTELKNNSPIIKIAIAGTEVKIRVFFSVTCFEIFFNRHAQGDIFKTAFSKSIFRMYKQTKDCEVLFTENDFVGIADADLLFILNEILAQDTKIKLEYEKTDCVDIYEKFYVANRAIIKKATADTSKSLEKMSNTYKLQNSPLLTSTNVINNIVMPTENLSGLKSAISMMSNYDFPKLNSTFSNIAKIPQLEIQSAVKTTQIDFSSLQSSLNSVPKVQFPELASALSNIPKPVFDVQAIVSPLQNLLESFFTINESIAQTLSAPILQIVEATQKIMSSIDFSLLIYRKKWSEQRETLLSYGWFNSDELPDELVNNIHMMREELSVEDVDNIIVAYFRQNQCGSLKKMVKRWETLNYFHCRIRIFHEALVNHSRKYFNSSVTLLTIHTEGVITDFVRTSLNSPRFKVEKAIKDIKKELDENEDVSIYKFEVFNDVIKQIEEAFNENFLLSDPDATSNKSRHKIAHGHAYEIENEVNSLKRFLYLNEIHCLFSSLSNSE